MAHIARGVPARPLAATMARNERAQWQRAALPLAARRAPRFHARIIPARNILPRGGEAAPNARWLSGPVGRWLPYSAGTIEGARAVALSSLRRSTARRIFAIMFRNARVSGFGVRKCEANSLLISSGRQ